MIYDSLGILQNGEDVWIKKYIDDNEKRPSSHDKNKEIKVYGHWLINQQKNYIINEQIMKNENIQKLWELFINDSKYKKYFLSNEDVWINTLEKIKKYIDDNNKRPSKYDENCKIVYYANWLGTQLKQYFINERIMKNEEIRKKWKVFINDNKYKKYFQSNEDNWINTLEIIKKYIDDNNKRPSTHSKNNQIKFYGNWISHQLKRYLKKEGLMKNETMHKLWFEFINNDRYKQYFLSNEETWINTLEKIKKYIVEKKKRPSNNNIENKSYAKWIGTQQINYRKKEQIMKNNNIYKLWFEFINDPIYSIFFK
jgi:hypothetical protein